MPQKEAKPIRFLVTLEVEFVADPEAIEQEAADHGHFDISQWNQGSINRYAGLVFEREGMDEILDTIENDVANVSVESGEVVIEVMPQVKII